MDCQRTKSPTPHVPSWTHSNKNSGVLGNYCTVLSVLYCGLWHNVAHLRISNPSIPASLMRTRQSANNGSVLSKIISVTFAMSVTLAADASLPGRLSYEWKTVSKPKHMHPEKALISEQGNEARPPENLSEDQLNTIPRKHKILHSWSFDAEVGAT